jgi:hypothetical protein
MITDIVLVALIAAVGSIVNSILGVAILVYQGKTHRTFNSKMDQALQAQRILGTAEGRLAEQISQRIREGEIALTKKQIDETIIK